MDDKTLGQIKDWIDFFREIGIEDFYPRSEPSAVTPDLQPKTVDQQPDRPLVEASALRPGQETVSNPKAAQGEPAVPEERLSFTPPFRPPSPAMPQSLSLFEEPAPQTPVREETLEEIRADLGDCRRCKLWRGRKHIVFGQGNAKAELVFVGEGPGADEDEQGLPFVGRAGQLLNRMLQLIQIRREAVYICNVVKCRPPGNRTPEPDEVAACSPFLYRQIAAIRPRLVCCLGAPAVRTVLGVKEGITKIHGRFYDYGNAKAIATVHPAYVLRNPREEVILREDFEKIRMFLEQ